jgi:hypothetical protein
MSESNKRNETADELRAQLAAANAQLALLTRRNLTIKRSAKGGVSVYGLGRFPVTLYKSQWRALLALAPSIEQFIRDHDHELPDKPPSK